MHTVEVHTTIRAVAPDEWDNLCGDRAFTHHRYLLLAESAMADHDVRYLLLRRGGQLVAAATGTLERRLQNAVLDKRFGWLVRRSPFLLISIPMTATAGLFIQDGPHASADLTALLSEIRALIRRERFLFGIIDHLPEGHPAATAHPSYRLMRWLPETRLDIVWSSFEDYLADLPRKRRQEIRRMDRRASDDGITVRPLVPTSGLSPTLDRLLANVVRQHGGTRHSAPEVFVAAAAALGDDLTVLAAHRDGHIVGCVGLLRSGDDLAARWIGRDYDRTAGTCVYHALVTACVRTAIAEKAHRLHLGAGAYDTKKLFGVALDPRRRLFTGRSRALNWLMGRLSHQFDPPYVRTG